jgi:hypothetical protein
MKNLNHLPLRAVALVFLLALLTGVEARAACFCDEIFEWGPYYSIQLSCTVTSSNPVAQQALADFRSQGYCDPNPQNACISRIVPVECEDFGGDYWQVSFSLGLGCRVCT